MESGIHGLRTLAARLESQKKGGSDGCFLLRFLRELTSRLAERSAGRGSCAGGVGADHTTLVCEEAPLAGGVLGHRRCRKRVASRGTYPDERVAALRCRVLGEHGVNQVRRRGAG